MTQYKGYDVLEILPNWISEPRLALSHDFDALEYLGASITGSQADETSFLLNARFTGLSRAEIWAIRSFFNTYKGRFGRFWLPSFRQDIKVTSAFAASDYVITIEDMEYASYWLPNDTTGRYIYFCFPDNTFAYNAIVDAPTSTSLELETVIGAACNASRLKFLNVGFLHFVRFSQDENQGEYSTPEIANFDLNFITIPHEAPGIGV